jgi:hypothetical protein
VPASGRFKRGAGDALANFEQLDAFGELGDDFAEQGGRLRLLFVARRNAYVGLNRA